MAWLLETNAWNRNVFIANCQNSGQKKFTTKELLHRLNKTTRGMWKCHCPLCIFESACELFPIPPKSTYLWSTPNLSVGGDMHVTWKYLQGFYFWFFVFFNSHDLFFFSAEVMLPRPTIWRPMTTGLIASACWWLLRFVRQVEMWKTMSMNWLGSGAASVWS